MGCSAICFSHNDLLIIRHITGKSEEIVQQPFNTKWDYDNAVVTLKSFLYLRRGKIKREVKVSSSEEC